MNPLLYSSRFVFCKAILAVWICFAASIDSHAQILQGPWVDASDAAINKHRKTEVTVIALDRDDRAIKGAKVEITQRRHDFVLGLTLPRTRMPPKDLASLPIYRCLNAIALDRYTDWSIDSPDTVEANARRLSAWQHAIEPIRTSFGRVISADPARNHDRLSLLEPADLRDAVLARIDLAAIFEPHPDDYDLVADLLNQDMVHRKLGRGMLHRMFDRAESRRPKADYAIRVQDGISLQRGREMVLLAQKLEVLQVPYDRVTIEQRFTGQVQPNSIKRMLDEYVAPLPVPATFVGFEVGAASDIAAGLNMETVLRLAFAQPNIDGVFLNGLFANELLEDNAALIDQEGQPTASGKVLDQLFHTHWRSNESGVSDERGNVKARVFTGWYDITATLPDGRVIRTEAYLPSSDRAKLIVLQATKAEGAKKQP